MISKDSCAECSNTANYLLDEIVVFPYFQIVYFGDSMHSDIFSAHHYSNWETVLILEELGGDGALVLTESRSEPLEKKGKYEVRIIWYNSAPPPLWEGLT